MKCSSNTPAPPPTPLRAAARSNENTNFVTAKIDVASTSTSIKASYCAFLIYCDSLLDKAPHTKISCLYTNPHTNRILPHAHTFQGSKIDKGRLYTLLVYFTPNYIYLEETSQLLDSPRAGNAIAQLCDHLYFAGQIVRSFQNLYSCQDCEYYVESTS